MTDNLPVTRPQALRPIVPANLDEAWRLATAIHKSRMAPPGYQTPEAITVAILHGLEIGLTPMAALQSIAVINGRPTVWGDGMVAIVRGSGVCAWIREYDNGLEGDQLACVCETLRVGEAGPVSRSFSVADAIGAGLWSKPGPWKQYPKRMLAARARSWCLRDVYADILRGIQNREEVEDYQPMRDVTPQATAPRPEPSPPPVDIDTGEVQMPASEPAVAEDKPLDPDAVLSKLSDLLAAASTAAECDLAFEYLDAGAALTHHPDMLAMAGMMVDRKKRKLGKKP